MDTTIPTTLEIGIKTGTSDKDLKQIIDKAKIHGKVILGQNTLYLEILDSSKFWDVRDKISDNPYVQYVKESITD